MGVQNSGFGSILSGSRHIWYVDPDAASDTAEVKTTMRAALEAVETARADAPYGPFTIFVVGDCYGSEGPEDGLGIDGTGLTIAGVPHIPQPYLECIETFFVKAGKPPPALKNLFWDFYNADENFLTLGADTWVWDFEYLFGEVSGAKSVVLINHADGFLVHNEQHLTTLDRVGARRWYEFTAAGAVSTYLYDAAGIVAQIASGAVGTWTVYRAGTTSSESAHTPADQSPTFTGTYVDPDNLATFHGVAAEVT